VHLKSLTLRGFKSFASSTTLRFEPGITCVVGPNGSGKSNVVDALAWVMGEQGAKSLRGGKMEDVIFAGTAGRPPLGRAEVVVTIDNTDGALPIEFAEVSISRIMFRNGGSEYAINGESCRLLDVQELLSDSGIGREMHVIVGQGQLDQVLSATPEDRRGFIEEAAGVLKHRKRKEKALRKLDAMQANLTRVQDLTAELRRQLKPLGKQAEVAKRAHLVQADLRDARMRLLADDLLHLRTTLQQEVADETALRERRASVEAELAQVQAREIDLEQRSAAQAPVLAAAQETWYRLSGLRERLRGTASLASERMRLSAEETVDDRPGRDPEELEGEARAVRVEEGALGEQVEQARVRLAAAVAARTAAEEALTAEQRRIATVERAEADRREGLARLTGQVGAARSRLETRETEIGRLSEALAEARTRAERAEQEFTALESQIAGFDEGEVDLDTEHERASAVLAAADARVAELREEERSAERERAALVARKETLELGLARKDGSSTLLAAGDQLSGVLGTVAALVSVEPGYETALAAALGRAADAVAVEGVGTAVDALRLLKDDDAGQAGLLVGSAEDDGSEAPWPVLPGEARYAMDLVQAPSALRPSLTRLLRRTAVVEGLAAARALVAAEPTVVAVTRDGDVLGAGYAYGGSATAPSLLEVQAAFDDATHQLTEAAHRAERLRFDLTRAGQERDQAAERVDAALSRLHESDARMAAVAEQLGQLGSVARAASAEAARLATSLADARRVTHATRLASHTSLITRAIASCSSVGFSDSLIARANVRSISLPTVSTSAAADASANMNARVIASVS